MDRRREFSRPIQREVRQWTVEYRTRLRMATGRTDRPRTALRLTDVVHKRSSAIGGRKPGRSLSCTRCRGVSRVRSPSGGRVYSAKLSNISLRRHWLAGSLRNLACQNTLIANSGKVTLPGDTYCCFAVPFGCALRRDIACFSDRFSEAIGTKLTSFGSTSATKLANARTFAER